MSVALLRSATRTRARVCPLLGQQKRFNAEQKGQTVEETHTQKPGEGSAPKPGRGPMVAALGLGTLGIAAGVWYWQEQEKKAQAVAEMERAEASRKAEEAAAAIEKQNAAARQREREEARRREQEKQEEARRRRAEEEEKAMIAEAARLEADILRQKEEAERLEREAIVTEERLAVEAEEAKRVQVACQAALEVCVEAERSLAQSLQTFEYSSIVEGLTKMKDANAAYLAAGGSPGDTVGEGVAFEGDADLPVSTGQSFEVSLAESVLEALTLWREGESSALADFSDVGPPSSTGPEDLRDQSNAKKAAAFERTRCKEKTAEELRARIVELSGALASRRLLTKPLCEEALMERLEAVESASLDKFDEATLLINSAHTKAVRDMEERLSVSLRQRHDEAVAAASLEAIAVGQRHIEEEKAKLALAAEQEVTTQQGALLPQVVSIRVGSGACERSITRDAALVKHAHAINMLAVSIVNLEDSILAGSSASAELDALRRNAEAADDFAAGVLAKMPERCVDLCKRGVVPTEPLMRQRLLAELHNLHATAFVPERAGLLHHAVARLFFRPLYMLSDGPDAGVIPGEDAQAARTRGNLEALGRAKTLVDGGQLQAALDHLEVSLSGSVRVAASSWMSETRDALLLWQVVHAVKARAQCLNAGLF